MKAARHRLNPRKLLLSKWTAAQPRNREKHFLVTELFCAEDGSLLQVVLGLRCARLGWRELEDAARWQMGWQ